MRLRLRRKVLQTESASRPVKEAQETTSNAAALLRKLASVIGGQTACAHHAQPIPQPHTAAPSCPCGVRLLKLRQQTIEIRLSQDMLRGGQSCFQEVGD